MLSIILLIFMVWALATGAVTTAVVLAVLLVLLRAVVSWS